MYVKAHRPVDTPAGNKGSCNLLAEYLEKENIGKETAHKTPFFSHNYDQVSKGTVVNRIDGNTKNLGRNDVKYYMLSINPSHRELQHLIKLTTGREGVESWGQLTENEKAKVSAALQDYTRDVMDLYAQNFNRDNVKTGDDLVYFAKIETVRKWHPWDKEVQNGTAVYRAEKPGLNLHVHVIVSRNDKTQCTKLSPQSKSRGGTQQLNGKNVMQGFNHVQWKNNCGLLFNQKYNYKPWQKETYNYEKRATYQSQPDLNTKTVNKLKHKVISAIKKEAAGGHFQQERAAIRKVKRVVNIIANPGAALKQELISKALSILKADNLKEK